MTIYKTYELVVTRADDNNFHRFVTTAEGENLDNAIAHHNFWCKDGDRIGTDWAVIEYSIRHECVDYPFDLEDAMHKALASKVQAIHKILQSVQDEQDQLDLIKCIVDDAPWQLSELDTAARDKFYEIMMEK